MCACVRVCACACVCAGVCNPLDYLFVALCGPTRACVHTQAYRVQRNAEKQRRFDADARAREQRVGGDSLNANKNLRRKASVQRRILFRPSDDVTHVVAVLSHRAALQSN